MKKAAAGALAVIALVSILIAAFLPPNPVNTPNSLFNPSNFTTSNNSKHTGTLSNPHQTLYLGSAPETINPTPNPGQSPSEMHKIISQFNLFAEETFKRPISRDLLFWWFTRTRLSIWNV